MTLSSAHLDQLVTGSAISPEVIAERAACTLSGEAGLAELERLGFAAYQRRVPGILFPVHTTEGEVLPLIWRPDQPRVSKKRGEPAKRIKYDQMAGSPVRLDCPPRCRPHLLDATTPLWISEGVKKGDSLASQGCCVLDVQGVWGFRTPKKLDPEQPLLPDWGQVQLADRQIGRKPARGSKH